MRWQSSRKWSVLIEVEPDGKTAACVTINGKPLLPAANGSTPPEALAYAECALVDARPGDIIEGTVRGCAASRMTFSVGSPSIALFWLKETLLSVVVGSRAERAQRSSES